MKKTDVEVGCYYDVLVDKDTHTGIRVVKAGTVLRCVEIQSKKCNKSYSSRKINYPIFVAIDDVSKKIRFYDHAGIEPSDYAGNEREFERLKAQSELDAIRDKITKNKAEIKRLEAYNNTYHKEQRQIEKRIWALKKFDSDEAELEWRVSQVLETKGLSEDERKERIREILAH